MPKVGVYICHCGENIAGVIDVEDLREYAAGLPEVAVTRRDLFMCSDPGQELIKKDIAEGLVDRVVVAACTPRTHEPIFRTALEAGGLNKYLFEMANIRDQASWVHPGDPPGATSKAKALLASAVEKARHLTPLEDKYVDVTPAAMVIGGGIAGIFSALELAKMGHQVYLVEKQPSIGGKMAQLDKTFPTNDCSACILTPTMVEAASHPNLELLTYSEVDKVEGYIGNFQVTVRKKQAYIDWEKCTGCGDCVEVCPVRTENEFNAGMDNRSAVYLQFPQAVPKKAVVDMDVCINCAGREIGSEPRISKKTGKPVLAPCERSCPAGASDRTRNWNPEGELMDIDVGTLIVATGYQVMDKKNFKYLAPESPNVLTALQLERLISATGPTGGKLERPSDHKTPKVISFLSCIGSRDANFHTYCSRVCCMYMIKQARLIKEKYPETDIYMHVIDVRAPGKDFEEYYTKAREMGINVVRGKVGGIQDLPGARLKVRGFDSDLGSNIEVDADMVVLATAMELPPETRKLAQTMGLNFCGSGFFKELHPKLKPVETAVEGIYLAGACQGPKDIPDTVAQAKGAAAAAAIPLSQGRVRIDPVISEVDTEKCSGCGICPPLCPYTAIRLKQVNEKPRAEIDITQCKGCGVCTAACPSGAIMLHGFSDKQILSQVLALS